MSEAKMEQSRYGWVMVFVAFTLSSLSFGMLGAISVFLKPISIDLGWSRGETSLAYTATSFSSALFGILWGYVADRFGTRWFGVAGAFMMTLAIALLSEQRNIYQFYAFYFMFGALGNALVTSPLFANVAFWFRENAGLALGITAAGGAVGQAVVPYLSGLGIEAWGWQRTYVVMAWVYLAIGLPVALLVRESPWRERARVAPQDETSDCPLSEIEVVAWISVAVIFCCNCMAVPIVHLVPLLTDAGQSLESAARVLAVLMFAGAFGRVYGGQLGDRIGALPAYMLMSLGQTISVFWFPHLDSSYAIYMLAIFFGFTYSGVMSSILVCTRQMVTAGFAARAMSITSFFGWGGMGLGGFFGGFFFDVTGAYSFSFAFAAVAGVINLFVLGLMWWRIKWKAQPVLGVAR